MSTAAFVVAIVGLLVAALSLGWQVASWALSGRRVKVVLLHGVQGRGGFATGPVGRNSAPRRIDSMRSQGWDGPEVLAIEVINVGRVTVTIRSYSVIAIGSGMSYTPIGNAIGKALPFRLEPGESETWYSDVQDAHALVRSVREIGKSATHVNMSVGLGTKEDRKTRHSIRIN